MLTRGFRVIEIPMEVECRKLVADPRQGKNMFALGILCNLYSLDLRPAREQVRITFGKKDERVVRQNLELLDAGWAWAEENLDFRYEIPAQRTEQTPRRRYQPEKKQHPTARPRGARRRARRWF